MADAPSARELEVQEKQEVTPTDEQTVPGRAYTPLTDIFETPDALIVVMEIPGVDKGDLDVRLEKDELSVNARISLETYGDMKPVHSEYSVGHFARRFRVSNAIDRDGIEAAVGDGVLTLTLPKITEATTRTIEVR